jgi:DNA-directed RNA polymerase subunit RPC12/RpoP
MLKVKAMNSHKRSYSRTASLLILAVLLLLPIRALAQDEPELRLRMSRDMGYSSGTGRIEGTFSLKASGPDDLLKVVFLIDGQTMGEDGEAPFSLRFNTGSYALGVHTLSATGTTRDGRVLNSQEIRVEFVPAEEGLKTAGRIAIPILGITFGIMLLGYVLPMIIGRGKKSSLPLGAPRRYGIMGGAICPKCGRPFSMTLLGLNLVAGRLERCPHCGKFSLVRRASPQMLRQAELDELQMATAQPAVSELSEQEHLRKELENSRYDEL